MSNSTFTQLFSFIRICFPSVYHPAPGFLEEALAPTRALQWLSQQVHKEGHPQVLLLEVFMVFFLITHYLAPHNTFNERFGL